MPSRSPGSRRTFQNLQLFTGLSVGQNVMVGHHCRMRATVLGSIFASPFFRREESDARTLAMSLLALVGLPKAFDLLADGTVVRPAPADGTRPVLWPAIHAC